MGSDLSKSIASETVQVRLLFHYLVLIFHIILFYLELHTQPLCLKHSNALPHHQTPLVPVYPKLRVFSLLCNINIQPLSPFIITYMYMCMALTM